MKELSRQVTNANREFMNTKLLDRAAIFNVFTQATNKIDKNAVGAVAPRLSGKDGDNLAAVPVTPFSPDAHLLGHLFERAGMFPQTDVDHAALIRGGAWVESLSSCFNSMGFRKSQCAA